MYYVTYRWKSVLCKRGLDKPLAIGGFATYEDARDVASDMYSYDGIAYLRIRKGKPYGRKIISVEEYKNNKIE